jgi:hypothetical protein
MKWKVFQMPLLLKAVTVSCNCKLKILKTVMFRNVVLIFLLTILISCSDRNDRNKPETLIEANGSMKSKETQIDTTIHLDYFYSFPPNYGLQGDYYTYDTTLLSAKKYIFLSDLTDSAIIKIRGTDIHLSNKGSKKLSENRVQDVWEGEGYTVTLTLKVVKEDDEKLYCTGTLEVWNKNSKSVFKVQGYSIA